MPINSFGYSITSRFQGFVPNASGSAGNLCLGGRLERYNRTAEIRHSGTTGTFSLILDLTQTPQPSGRTTITAGQTWNFQAWFRDNAGGVPASNFTDGVHVVFF